MALKMKTEAAMDRAFIISTLVEFGTELDFRF
ncbi:hypothetical protein CCACVL1_00638 [Corchorus capsularis]|uniref:Uncharacterized protein n=1 Tax=Corchorus capsularis TaxID=210143 RepID=A0A1R3KVW8_COCAP|nr:hypothetical protein CCACVL1_00638 [Corchorus capsularis]